MSEPDVAAVIRDAAAKAKAAEAAAAAAESELAAAATANAAPVVDADPRIADLMGKGLSEAEARQLIASMW